MDKYFQHLSLEESDDDSDEETKLEPLGTQELKLMNFIKNLIKRRKYEDIPKLFTTGKYASTNVEMLPRMSMHLYREVCKQHLTEETYEENQKLYKCAEELLKRIAGYAPVEDFLFEVTDLLGFDSPDCVFNSTLGVLESPLLRVPDDNTKTAINDFEHCLDEIALRMDLYAPMPTLLLVGNSEEIEARMDVNGDLQYIAMFHANVRQFYCPLVKEICSYPRPGTEIFRSYVGNKRNVLCCFLLKMLQKPLALFDLRCSQAKKKSKGLLLLAISLTQAITKCIRDPFSLLTFVEQNVRWASQLKMTSYEEDSNYFVNELETESLAIYYYMVIVEGIDASQVPKVYHPQYVCEMGLYLVHYLLFNLPAPALQYKALSLASKLLTNLRHFKIQSLDLDLFIYNLFLNDLRKLALTAATVEVLLQTVHVLKLYLLCFGDDDKYFILKNLIAAVNHSSFCGYLISLYKDFATEALKAPPSTPLPTVFTGEKLRAIFLENICKLQHGIKTDPAENCDKIESALNTILTFATIDTENRTGFWCFINEIVSQFISPLRKALHVYDARFKTELHHVLQGRGKGKCCKNSKMDKYKNIDMWENNRSDIAKLLSLLTVVCDSLVNSPIDDQNNNINTNSVKAK